jgi:hypothetical protein
VLHVNGATNSFCESECRIGFVANPDDATQCLICRTACTACVPGMVLYKGVCYDGSCPFGSQLIQGTQTCEARILPSVKILTPNGDISMLNDLTIRSLITSLIPITKIQWLLVAPDEPTNATRRLFFSNSVSSSFSSLMVPQKNLVPNTIYTLRIDVSNNEGMQSETITFTTVNMLL